MTKRSGAGPELLTLTRSPAAMVIWAPLSRSISQSQVVPSKCPQPSATVSIVAPGPVASTTTFSLFWRTCSHTVSDEAGAWMTGRAGLDLFDRSMRMTVRADRALGGAPDLRLGGLQDPLLSRAAQAERILQPALPWDAAGGRAHLAMDAALGVSGVEGFFTRHTLSDAWTLDAGTSLVGVRARTSERAMPMVKLPASRLGAGVACRLEDPEAGFAERPCQSLDAWTLWLDVRWTVD